jgi:membrane protein implicated in regulation of membrane protease activity
MAAMLAFIVCAIAAAMATADAAIAATGTIPRPVTTPVIPVIVVIPVIPVIAIVMIIIVMIVVTVMVPIIVLRVLRTSAGFTRTAADLGNVRGQPPSRAAIERGRIHAGGRRGCCGGQGTIGPEPLFQARSPPVFLAAAGDDGAG